MALPKKLPKKLLKSGQPFSFKKGQVLFYEGHSPYGLFVLQSGDVKFSSPCQGCLEEHSPMLQKEKVLGLKPFFEGTPYCCTCTAKKNCHGIFVSKTQLQCLTS